MMISKDICIKLILEKFPDFFPFWNTYKTEYDFSTVFGEMAEFSSYVAKLLMKEEYDSFKINEIFSYMEYLLVNGDEDVKDAISTCFLENIINQSPEQIDPKRFVKYLGFESKEYCRAWDRFTGVQTEGLWSDSW